MMIPSFLRVRGLRVEGMAVEPRDMRAGRDRPSLQRAVTATSPANPASAAPNLKAVIVVAGHVDDQIDFLSLSG
jgi:hypothetical protein